MSESEDRSQTPSKRRREQAREAGIVAQSPELTGAIALLAALGLLAVLGDSLLVRLLELVRAPLLGLDDLTISPFEAVAHLRNQVLRVAFPLFGLLTGTAIAALLAHQIQVGGLWVPGRLAPDISRMALGWPGMGTGLLSQGGRGLWGLAKALIVSAVAFWVISQRWADFQVLGRLDGPALASASGRAVRALSAWLALAIVVLGLIDFAIQYARIEARMRMTPEESREDLRSNDGDPALRARRRKLAQGWRSDPADALADASLVITGTAGLTIVLGGGPPPRMISFRAIATGAAGRRLRQAAEVVGLAHHNAPELAQSLWVRRSPGQPIPSEVARELLAAWPDQQV